MLIVCECPFKFTGQSTDTFTSLCTPAELRMVNEIRGAVAVNWSSGNLDHMRLLLKVWKIACPGSHLVSNEDVAPSTQPKAEDELEELHERFQSIMKQIPWKELGFQHSDPTSDIRGSRYLGVKHLAIFAQQYGIKMRAMIKDHPLFPFAACSFNVTYTLVYHLQLNTKIEGIFISPYGGLEEPTFQISDGGRRSDYLGFLGLLPLVRGKDGPESLLANLHGYALIAVLNTWQKKWRIAKNTAGMTAEQYFLMNFNREVLPSAWRHVENLLIQRPHTLAELDFNHRQVHP